MLSVDSTTDLKMFLKVVYMDSLTPSSDSSLIIDKARTALDFTNVNIYPYIPFNLFK